jgi:hypothetical protein
MKNTIFEIFHEMKTNKESYARDEVEVIENFLRSLFTDHYGDPNAFVNKYNAWYRKNHSEK